MCRAGPLTPAASVMVAELLRDLRTALAEQFGCDPAEVLVGPVDLGGEDD
jgi:hypothetical protein